MLSSFLFECVGLGERTLPSSWISEQHVSSDNKSSKEMTQKLAQWLALELAVLNLCALSQVANNH